MTQNCKVTFGNVTCLRTEEKDFESKQDAFKWVLHKLVVTARLRGVHEIYFRIESNESAKLKSYSEDLLPFDSFKDGDLTPY